MSEISEDPVASGDVAQSLGNGPPLLEKITNELTETKKSAKTSTKRAQGTLPRSETITSSKSKKLAATTAHKNVFPLANFTIPKKKIDEDKLCERLDRMEALMNKHMEKAEEFKDTMKSANEQFKEEVMHALSFDDQGDEHTQYSQYYGEEAHHDDHTMSDDDDIEEKISSPTESPPSPKAENNDMAQAKMPSESTPSGFAAKFAMTTVGEEIDPDVASSMQYLLTNRLAETPLNDMLDRYITPKNARNMCVPKVNTQIWDSLKPHTRNTDLKLQKVQKLLMKGAIAVATTKEELTEDQMNGLTCLATASYEMNMLRRDLIKPGLHEKFSQLCKPTVPVTENLFGNDLTKHIKDIDEVHKATGKMAKQPRFAPYSYPRRGRGGRGYPYNNNAPFLGRGSAQPQRQPFKPGRGLLSAKRGRGRGAGRGQQQ